MGTEDVTTEAQTQLRVSLCGYGDFKKSWKSEEQHGDRQVFLGAVPHSTKTCMLWL